MKHIYLTVTNDLTYDQRMNRICHSLAANGFRVTLTGRKLQNSLPLKQKTYTQKRLKCFFNKGFLFYAEYNTRLFFFLLFQKADGICAIDLDTILPCLFIAKLKRIPLIYDAHELFTELKEVRTRPFVLRAWTAIERFAVPRCAACYTVSDGLATEFFKRYQVRFTTIRNLPNQKTSEQIPASSKFILYQGAVNEGRGFEYIIPAMKKINCPLVICGDGNFMKQLRQLIREFGVEEKIMLKGMLEPEELNAVTSQAYIGINFTERDGLNQYLCLPNKFFDYIQAGVPQVTNNYPEYNNINSRYKVALLIQNLDEESIAEAVNRLLEDELLYAELKQNTLTARSVFHWQNEEPKLIGIYKNIFP